MATCQNGYPVAFSREAIPSGPATVIPKGSTRKFTFRTDMAAAWQILLDTLHQFVESVHEGYKDVDDWSYTVRPVRGQTTGYSNHSGACACDWNATQHPLGTLPTANWTKTQLARIRECMAKFVGLGKRVFRFGGDYTGRKDPMHFEVIGTLAQIRAFVAAWRAGKIRLSFIPDTPPANAVTVPTKPPVVGTPAFEHIFAAQSRGLGNVEHLAKACDVHELPFHMGLAILEKESGGRNVYGHDTGGVMSVPGQTVEVTQDNYAEFRRLIAVEGSVSNGVGPMQITWKPHFAVMDSLGLEAWRPADNISYGVKVLADSMRTFLAQGKSVDDGFWQAAKLYNGAAAYADDAAAKAAAWAKVIAAARPIVSLKAVNAGLRNGTEVVEGPTGRDGAEFQRALNRYTGFDLIDDGVLGRNTRTVTAQAQVKVGGGDPGQAWPNRGYLSDFDGYPGTQLFAALKLNNSDTPDD